MLVWRLQAPPSVVLTGDLTGPLKDAYKRGWKVLYLKDWEASGQSLGDFIEAAWNSWLPGSVKGRRLTSERFT